MDKAAYYNGKEMTVMEKSVVTMINESKNRLERARFQYENLLLHAGNALLLSSTPPRSLSNSPQYSKFANSKLKSPMSGDFQQNALLKEDFLQSHPKSISPISYKGLSNSVLFEQPEVDPPNVSEKEKDDIILTLQEENERLRERLQEAIDSAQQIIEDAQITNDHMVETYESRLKELEERNQRLQTENQQLKVSLDLAQAERDVERDQLSKSLKIIERFKKRSKEYLEIQKKTHQILSQPDGFHFAIYANNPLPNPPPAPTNRNE